MSLRWVQVLAPTNSARTPARSDSRVRPPRRPALATASGHSNQGSGTGRGRGLQQRRRWRRRPWRARCNCVHDRSRPRRRRNRVRGSAHRPPRPATSAESVPPSGTTSTGRRRRRIPWTGAVREPRTRQRIVAGVERGRGRSGHDRGIVLGEALHDRAAGLPTRAQVGLLEHRESGRRGLLQRLPQLLVGPRARLRACVLGRVARDQGRHREVVEQLVDGTADDVVARAIDPGGDRLIDRGAEAGRRRAPDELFETRDRRGRGDRGDALRVDEVDRRLDRGGVEHLRSCRRCRSAGRGRGRRAPARRRRRAAAGCRRWWCGAPNRAPAEERCLWVRACRDEDRVRGEARRRRSAQLPCTARTPASSTRMR